jgi:hypothetical protein
MLDSCECGKHLSHIRSDEFITNCSSPALVCRYYYYSCILSRRSNSFRVHAIAFPLAA